MLSANGEVVELMVRRKEIQGARLLMWLLGDVPM